MTKKEIAEKIRTLINKSGSDSASWVCEAIQEDYLDELLDEIYKAGAKISPEIVREQLEKYYNVNSQKDKLKIDYLINKHQYLIIKTMFDTKN